MIQEKQDQSMDATPAEAGWHNLYWLAGIAILISLVFVLLDMALSFADGNVPVGGMDATGWFVLIHNNWFMGLRNLGLLNILNPILAIPLYLVLYRVHHTGNPASAALALLLYVLGAAIYIAHNQALAMLTLSQQYASATTEAQKQLLVSAGTVALAQAEDFTPGSFPGLFLNSLGSFAMMAVILRGKVFSRRIAWVGLIGSGALLSFTVCATFAPSIFQLLMIVAMVGGLLMLAWDLLIALAMFRLARLAPPQPMRPNLPAHRARPVGEM